MPLALVLLQNIFSESINEIMNNLVHHLIYHFPCAILILQDSSQVDYDDIISENEEEFIEIASANEDEDEDEGNHDLFETSITLDDSDDSEFELLSEEEEPPTKTRRPKTKSRNTIQ